MASASHPPAHPALQPADRLILPPQQPPAAVETSIGPPHYPAECTQSDAFVNRACAPARGTQTLIRFVGILRGQKCLKRRFSWAIPRRRHRPADQWRSERRRDPCTFRLGCHAPLCLTADAERPPGEEIMSIGGAHGARGGTGPTYLDCPLSRGALYLILQNRISRGSGSPEIKLHRRGR